MLPKYLTQNKIHSFIVKLIYPYISDLLEKQPSHFKYLANKSRNLPFELPPPQLKQAKSRFITYVDFPLFALYQKLN
jgi:hypothetical protein